MEDEASKSSEPAWLDPSNDRKTPYSDAELDRLTDDQIAMLADTPAWRNLVADVGSGAGALAEDLKAQLAPEDTARFFGEPHRDERRRFTAVTS